MNGDANQTTAYSDLGWRVVRCFKTDAFGPHREVWQADASYIANTIAAHCELNTPRPDYARFAYAATEQAARDAVMAICRADPDWSLVLEPANAQ